MFGFETKSLVTPLTRKESRDRSDNVERTLEITESELRNGDLAEGAVSAFKLSLFNYFNLRHSTDNTLTAREIHRLRRLSAEERSYQERACKLPTIGIELEMPYFGDKDEAVFNWKILDYLKIQNRDESVGISQFDGIWEVNPPPSLSPLTPARLIQELVILGAIELNDTGKGMGEVSELSEMSLHVNLGCPKTLKTITEKETKNKALEDQISRLSLLLGLAYASPHRIETKKTHRSFKICTERLELAIGEFRDAATYRMLADAQRMIMLLYTEGYLKYGIPTTGYSGNSDFVINDQLESTSMKFSSQLQDFFDRNYIDATEFSDHLERPHLADLMRTMPELAREARQICRATYHDVEAALKYYPLSF